MSEKNNCTESDIALLSLAEGADTAPCDGLSSSEWRKQAPGSDRVVRLMVELERALRSELPVAKRISFLRNLLPLVGRVTERLPKPVVSSQQSLSDRGASQTLEQRLNCLMAKNLKRALEEMGQSEVAYTQVSKHLHWWLARNLFHCLGGLIEYSVHWGKPYPSGIWQTLHELYRHILSRVELAEQFDLHRDETDLDPEIEYKRLLLLGLTRDLSPVGKRPPGLFEALPALAKASRLVRAETCAGAFGLLVVEVARDEPPHYSGMIERGFGDWVIEPARGFFDLVGNRKQDARPMRREADIRDVEV